MTATPRKIDAQDLLTMRFVSQPQLSPDGTQVVFVSRWIDAEKNKYFSNLWLVSTAGGQHLGASQWAITVIPRPAGRLTDSVSPSSQTGAIHPRFGSSPLMAERRDS